MESIDGAPKGATFYPTRMVLNRDSFSNWWKSFWMPLRHELNHFTRQWSDVWMFYLNNHIVEWNEWIRCLLVLQIVNPKNWQIHKICLTPVKMIQIQSNLHTMIIHAFSNLPPYFQPNSWKKILKWTSFRIVIGPTDLPISQRPQRNNHTLLGIPQCTMEWYQLFLIDSCSFHSPPCSVCSALLFSLNRWDDVIRNPAIRSKEGTDRAGTRRTIPPTTTTTTTG